ncbi:MAG: M81 family metallopeptidase [Candidatus Latescibacterota bacterium]|nr:M81 family metallopeptidase [Candidatus Latescibacterota bacterium]
MRIAIGSILTECNQFGGSAIDIDWFARYDLFYGKNVLNVEGGVVGGGLEALKKIGVEIVPLIYASTCPGGYITKECYKHLRGELLSRLQAAMPVDGILLPLHGASYAEGTPDPEGDILGAVRQIVGKEIPIVATLDLHAHVTPAMVHNANALLAWETYPHRDSKSTGSRGAELLTDIIQSDIYPTMAMVKVPVITGGILGGTDGHGAFAELMRQTKALENKSGVLSTSLFLTHPYLDQPCMGSGALVITDNDIDQAKRLGYEISAAYWEQRHEIEANVITPEKAIESGLKSDPGTVVLVETADCSGGGAAGDSVATLRALLSVPDVDSAIAPVVDPKVAKICHNLGVGSTLDCMLGHSLDTRWGSPLHVEGKIEALFDGSFVYEGGIWDEVKGDMGPCAVLKSKGVRILVTSYATYDWADEQWQAVGIDPRLTRFAVAKNPMNFHNVYSGCASQVHILDTPGPTPASVKNLPFKNLTHPCFPINKDIHQMEPIILT